MNIIRKEQDFWKVKNTTDDCVMSLINSGNLQAQAALDAPVYYYHPDHLVLVGSPTRLCDPLGSQKAQYAVLGRGGRMKRLKPQSGFLQLNFFRRGFARIRYWISTSTCHPMLIVTVYNASTNETYNSHAIGTSNQSIKSGKVKKAKQ